MGSGTLGKWRRQNKKVFRNAEEREPKMKRRSETGTHFAFPFRSSPISGQEPDKKTE